MEQKKRAWLYCRIDTPEDTHGTLKIQKKELVDYAEQMKFEIVGSSEDLGSLRIFERPGLAECVQAAESGKIYGSVNALQIAEAIKDQFNYDVDRKKIHIDGDAIKELGEYKAKIVLHKEIQATINFEVFAE